MLNIQEAARRIVARYNDDTELANSVNHSPEPIRAMIYETAVIDAPGLDGTPYFLQLMDAIEELY